MDSLANYGSDDESGEFNDSSKVFGLLIDLKGYSKADV